MKLNRSTRSAIIEQQGIAIFTHTFDAYEHVMNIPTEPHFLSYKNGGFEIKQLDSQ